MINILKGSALAGTSNTRERVDDDYYATPEETTRAILDVEKLEGSIYECAAGQGHIVKVLKEYYPNSKILASDLVDRGLEGCKSGLDFITYEFKSKVDNIITNPPFVLAQEFIEKALTMVNKKVIMFAKIQLLEGKARKSMFANTPLKYVYVFSERQNPLRNGSPVDENGKKWSSTMCFAWYVWEIGYEGEPTIKWL